MYAIIATGGKQYKVKAGDKVRVEKLEAEVGSQITFDKVLMVSADETFIGNPCVDGAAVEGEVTDQGKGRKVIVYKYKPKTGYHKKNGHRQPYTEVLITKVIVNGTEYVIEEEAPVEEAAAEEAPAEEVTEEVEEVTEETAEEAAEEEAPAEEA